MVEKISQRIQILYTKMKKLIEYCRKRNQWKNNQSLQLQREIYDKILHILPSLLGYGETYIKSCIIIDKCTVEKEHTENE